MSNEERLARALAASSPPLRDPAFTLAVIRAAERGQFGAETLRSILRGAGFSAAAAVLALPLLEWVGNNAQAVQTGALGAVALVTLVLGARLMSQRMAALWAR